MTLNCLYASLAGIAIVWTLVFMCLFIGFTDDREDE